jgi:hypothetical protein
MEKAELADLHKALGKDMLEQPPHELEGLEARALVDSGPGIGVSEGNRVIVEAHDALV